MEGEESHTQYIEQPQPEKWYIPLTRVTPLSKYLAIGLFVALPFVGFWLGVEYAELLQTEQTLTQEQRDRVTPSVEVTSGNSVLATSVNDVNMLSSERARAINMDEHFGYVEQMRASPIDDEVDVETFEYLGGGYYRDQYRAYYISVGGGLLAYSNAHPSTFTPIGGGYARDVNAVYCGEQRRSDVDFDTFHPIDIFFAADKDYVYWGLREIPEATEDTFKLLNKWYGKSARYVYLFFESPTIIEEADVDTFRVLVSEIDANNDTRYLIGKDEFHVFAGDELQVGVSPDDCTLETLEKCVPSMPE